MNIFDITSSLQLLGYNRRKYYLRFSEHGKSGPGFPFIVCASDIFGGNPKLFPCLTTSSTSACHHSPAPANKHLALRGRENGKQNFPWAGTEILTQDNGFLPAWLREGKWSSFAWQDDNCTINCGPQPKNMCMPPQCPSLSCYIEGINITTACLNWTLCYISRSICPSIAKLFQSMPAKITR